MYNQVTLIGNLGKDPTEFEMSNGAKGAFLSIATHETRGDKKETSWHSVVVYDKLAELCLKYLRSGRLVHVVGVLQHRQKEKNGVKYTESVVKARDVNFLDNPVSKPFSNAGEGPVRPTPPSTELREEGAITRTSNLEKITLNDSEPKTKSSMYGHGSSFIEHLLEEDLKLSNEG